jgi:hypothetical protein
MILTNKRSYLEGTGFGKTTVTMISGKNKSNLQFSFSKISIKLFIRISKM